MSLTIPQTVMSWLGIMALFIVAFLFFYGADWLTKYFAVLLERTIQRLKTRRKKK